MVANGDDLFDPQKVSEVVRESLRQPDLVLVSEQYGRRDGTEVELRSLRVTTDDLPRLDGSIAVHSGSVWLRLDDTFQTSELYDSSDIWIEIVQEFVETAETYFGGEGEVRVDPRGSGTITSLVISVRDSELLLDGPRSRGTRRCWPWSPDPDAR